MQTLLSITVDDKTGDLQITATPEGIEYLGDQLAHTVDEADAMGNYPITWKQAPVGMWSDMLESYSCNGSYNLAPDNTFALTEAPIIASEPGDTEDREGNEYPNGFTYDPETKFWNFGDYAIIDEFEKLLNGETVVFTLIPGEDITVNKPELDKVLNELIQIEDTLYLLRLQHNEEYTHYSAAEIETEMERRYAIKAAEDAKILTPTQQLQFILKNDPDNEKYDIEKIFHSSFCRALSKALPYTHFSRDTNYLFTKYGVDYTNTVKQEATRFEKYVTDTLKLSIADFTLYYYCSSMHRTYWLRYSNELQPKKDYLHFSMSADGYTDLAHLVMYLVDQKYLPTYKETNEFLDAQVPKICYSNKSAYQYTYGNITVKRFANGRIDIKGMTTDQKAILDKLFALHEKLKNI